MTYWDVRDEVGLGGETHGGQRMASSDWKWTGCLLGVEMPESECADPEAKTWLLRRLTPLAHFGFQNSPAGHIGKAF